MRGPGDDVHGSGVQGEVGHAGPLVGGFAPDEDFAVIRGGGEDGAVFWVGLCLERGEVVRHPGFKVGDEGYGWMDGWINGMGGEWKGRR